MDGSSIPWVKDLTLFGTLSLSHTHTYTYINGGFPGCSNGKQSAKNAGFEDETLRMEGGRLPRNLTKEGKGNSLQYSYL